MQIMTWWMPGSPVHDMRGIIADGAVRSGKTVPMSLSFIEWGMTCYDQHNFIIGSKTVGSLQRNIISWLLSQLRAQGYFISEKRTENYFECHGYGHINKFYCFGGKDEASQDLVQGITAAGALLDEAALMPASFVNQVIARTLSVKGSKVWFNCNPGAPNHFIKTDWIDCVDLKRMFHLHFLMEDNPILDEQQIADAKSLYTGVFYKRYIMGEWCAADGLIFDSFDDDNIYSHELPLHYDESAAHYIVGDYGTQNAFVLLYIIWDGHKAWVEDEYYYSGRASNKQLTNAEYLEAYIKFRGERPIRQTILDPSAASFKIELRRAGYRVIDADNDVLEGIRLTSSLFHTKRLMIKNNCVNLINKLRSYVWKKGTETNEEEKPLKIDDDPCDAIRYFCKTVIKRES